MRRSKRQRERSLTCGSHRERSRQAGLTRCGTLPCPCDLTDLPGQGGCKDSSIYPQSSVKVRTYASALLLSKQRHLKCDLCTCSPSSLATLSTTD